MAVPTIKLNSGHARFGKKEEEEKIEEKNNKKKKIEVGNRKAREGLICCPKIATLQLLIIY